MNKADFVAALRESSAGADLEKLPKVAADRIANACFEVMAATLASGESVSITGFGTLSVKQRESRIRVNPATHEKFMAPASKTVVFHPGKGLKERVNA